MFVSYLRWKDFTCVLGPVTPCGLSVTAKHLQHASPLYKSPCGSGAAELHLRKIKLGLNKIKQR